MISKEDLVNALYAYGQSKALELQSQGATLSGTALIAQETFIPAWRPGSYNTVGAPVAYQGQVYQVLQAHDSTGNAAWTPAATPALFSICHTTDPEHAKPWQAPQGTSGMYQKDECYRDGDGVVWRQTYDGGNVYDATTLPERWQRIL